MSGNRQITLAQRPTGMPTDGCFALIDSPLPSISDGKILIQNLIFSMDPAIRGFLDDRKSYLAPVAIGEAVRGMTLGRVVQSRNPDYPEGTIVRTMAAWEDYSVIGEAIGLERVDPDPAVDLADYMGLLGATGLTAWVGLRVIAEVNAGESLLVSAAAGAVGNVVGQIGKILGCRTIGLTSTDAKASRLTNFGYDNTINYKTARDLTAAIRGAAPDGIDVYFDNVGGPILEATLPAMALNGRVVICGMIADYNSADTPYGVKSLWQIVVHRLFLRGFLTYDHAEHLPRAHAELAEWMAAGKLKPVHTLHMGLEAIPGAFRDMLTGKTTGKALVQNDL